MAGVHCESQIFRDQCCFVAQLPDCRQTGIRNSVTSAFDAIRSQEAPVANARRSILVSLFYLGVLTPFLSISMAFPNLFNRVSSFLASVIQQQYSLRWV